MGRGRNLNNVCKVEEGPVVRGLGRRMVGGEWSPGEEPLVTERRVMLRESMTFAWVPKTNIVLELCQIPLFSLYFDLADHQSKQ